METYTKCVIMWVFQNKLGFSLYTTLFVCHIVATSEDKIESKESDVTTQRS